MVLSSICTDEVMKIILRVAIEKDEDVYVQATDKEAAAFVKGSIGSLKTLSLYLFDTDTSKEIVKHLNDQEKHLRGIAIRRPMA